MKRKNVTVQIDEALLKQSRHLAVDRNMSLSEWIAELMRDAVGRLKAREAAKRRAYAVLDKPLHLGGGVFSRDELHEN